MMVTLISVVIGVAVLGYGGWRFYRAMNRMKIR